MKRAFVCVLLVLCFAAAAAQEKTSQSSATPAASQTESGNAAASIAAAKAAHKVWVNLDTGIYHKGGRWYGKTKTGKFMTEDDAKKAGYKPAKRD